VLGNIGDEGDKAALGVATNNLDPLVREHAEWALEQISS
jgi:epoxyqueuosine reductase QueG